MRALSHQLGERPGVSGRCIQACGHARLGLQLARPGPSPGAATPVAGPASCSGGDHCIPPTWGWVTGEDLITEWLVGRRGVIRDPWLY